MTKFSILSLLILSIFTLSCKESAKLGVENRIVQIDTEYGAIKIRLYDETPAHRDNFIKLAHNRFFDGTIFHRVIDGFMIQGGDPDSKNAEPNKTLGEGGPGYNIPAEFNANLFHKKGVLAAARKGDKTNPDKKSSGSQFYIVQGKVYETKALEQMAITINEKRTHATFEIERDNYKAELTKLKKAGDIEKFNSKVEEMKQKVDSISKTQKFILTDAMKEAYTTVGGTPHLDGIYTVYGEVIEGLEIVDKIALEETDEKKRPLKDIKMKVTIIQ